MIFRRALIRLTVTYTALQLLLFGVFALGVYTYVIGAFDFDSAEFDGQYSLNIAEQGFTNLRIGLISGYAILMVLIPVSSYLMARRALAPVRRSYELQQRFVDGASHEFRTPLSVIQGELELALSRSRTPKEYRSAMANALESAQGLTKLTDDLLLLTRDNADELESSFEPVSLNDLAHRVTRAQAANSDRVSVIESREIVVEGSKELLERAISNLVENAVKFSSESGTIEIAISSDGKTAQLAVRDEGVGMTKTDAAHAFDRFWRAQEARDTPGFGLGLSLVHQIVVAHNGKVSIASSEGKGTTVAVTLPEYTQ